TLLLIVLGEGPTGTNKKQQDEEQPTVPSTKVREPIEHTKVLVIQQEEGEEDKDKGTSWWQKSGTVSGPQQPRQQWMRPSEKKEYEEIMDQESKEEQQEQPTSKEN